jgi:acetolactate synthase-1/2/3 large subunit
VAAADLVIAAGTEMGPTDYDMYGDGGFVHPARLVRIDIDAAQLERRPATVPVRADCGPALAALAVRCARKAGDGKARAARARQGARAEIGQAMRAQVEVIETIRDALPRSIIVGDSTQPVYAANLCYGHDRPGGWFNAATGFGALGYGLPAAIGASLAAPADTPVVCFSGDGGFQFTLSELATAVDAGTPVIAVVWNNSGYREIEVLMREAGVEPVGVSPAPPDFRRLAAAYGVSSERLDSAAGLGEALSRARAARLPWLIEIMAG